MIGLDHYICDCSAGFSGQNCANDIDECLSDPCLHHGTCTTGPPDQYNCSCVDYGSEGAGYTGTNCEVELDECASSPCQNAAECVDIVADYLCFCAVGWYGNDCDGNVDDCASVPCANNATCSDFVDSFTCACSAGWEGALCDEEVDVCYYDEDDCDEAHATCSQTGPGLHRCDCDVGFESIDNGVTCTNIDDCPDPDTQYCVDNMDEPTYDATNESCIIYPTGFLWTAAVAASCTRSGAPDMIATNQRECEYQSTGNLWSPFVDSTCLDVEDRPMHPHPSDRSSCELRSSGFTWSHFVEHSCILGERSNADATDETSCETERTGNTWYDEVPFSCTRPDGSAQPGAFDEFSCFEQPTNNTWLGRRDGCVDENGITTTHDNYDDCEMLYFSDNSYVQFIPANCTASDGSAVNLNGAGNCEFQNTGYNWNPAVPSSCTALASSWTGSWDESIGVLIEDSAEFYAVNASNQFECELRATGYRWTDSIPLNCSAATGEILDLFTNETCLYEASNYTWSPFIPSSCLNADGETKSPVPQNGTECETYISGNRWINLGCQNGAHCTDSLRAFTCTCAPGWAGTLCDHNVDECASYQCQHGARCEDAVDAYICHCVPGWNGTHCENDIDECASAPCQNGASCSDSNSTAMIGLDHYICDCSAGFSGQNCANDIDECLSDPCLHHGTCTTGPPDQYNCSCVDYGSEGAGYTGTNCEVELDECASSPCQNAAECVDIVADYLCFCAVGWYGKDCDGNVDDCASVPCANNATCSDFVDSFTCACSAGWEGALCDEEVDVCYYDEDDCDEAHATCSQTGPGLHRCDCDVGFESIDNGVTCTNIDDCSWSPHSIVQIDRDRGYTSRPPMEFEAAIIGASTLLPMHFRRTVAVESTVPFSLGAMANSLQEFIGDNGVQVQVTQRERSRPRIAGVSMVDVVDIDVTISASASSSSCKIRPTGHTWREAIAPSCVHGGVVYYISERECRQQRRQWSAGSPAGCFDGEDNVVHATNLWHCEYETNTAIWTHGVAGVCRNNADNVVSASSEVECLGGSFAWSVPPFESCPTTCGEPGFVFQRQVACLHDNVTRASDEFSCLLPRPAERLECPRTLDCVPDACKNPELRDRFATDRESCEKQATGNTWFSGLPNFCTNATGGSMDPFPADRHSCEMKVTGFTWSPYVSHTCLEDGVAKEAVDSASCEIERTGNTWIPRVNYSCARPDGSPMPNAYDMDSCFEQPTGNVWLGRRLGCQTENGTITGANNFYECEVFEFPDNVHVEPVEPHCARPNGTWVTQTITVEAINSTDNSSTLTETIVTDIGQQLCEVRSTGYTWTAAVPATCNKFEDGQRITVPATDETTCEYVATGYQWTDAQPLRCTTPTGNLTAFVTEETCRIEETGFTWFTGYDPTFEEGYDPLNPFGSRRQPQGVVLQDTADHNDLYDILGHLIRPTLPTTGNTWTSMIPDSCSMPTGAALPFLADRLQLVLSEQFLESITEDAGLPIRMNGSHRIQSVFLLELDNSILPDPVPRRSVCATQAACVDHEEFFTCECEIGWDGMLCDRNVDDCASYPCHGSSFCVDEVDSYKCVCTGGWTGPHCEVDIDECDSRPCQNDGACSDSTVDMSIRPDTYRCQCTGGWAGENCNGDMDECSDSRCQNGGTCSTENRPPGQYGCACVPGFTGNNCEVNVDECASGPCQHGGYCSDQINTYSCICTTSWTGHDCEVNINMCDSFPCANGGVCTDQFLCIGTGACEDIYTCACSPGFVGYNCGEDVNECFSRPCLNGGACYQSNTTGAQAALYNVQPDEFKCRCADGWSGDTCVSAVAAEDTVRKKVVVEVNVSTSIVGTASAEQVAAA
eukprot:SAG31_NODE_456_length_15426_cov_12.680107_4_plen_1842_part_01